jgi:hypothetical protein
MSTTKEQTAYEIISKRGSASMGAYRAESPAEALAKQVRDAGYSAEVVDEATVRTGDPAPCGGYEVQGDDETYSRLEVRQ